MGWTILDRPLRRGETVDSFMRSEMSWREHDAATGDLHEILDTSIDGSVWYAAVQVTKAGGESRVFALVSLTTKRGGFGYKDMSEHAGPNECACPLRIINLLTPTDGEYANDWRERCRQHAASKRLSVKVKPGDRVTFAQPVSFGGVPLTDFVVVPTPARTRGVIAHRADGGEGLYRLRAAHLADATVTRAA